MADKLLRLPLPLYACMLKNQDPPAVLLWDLDAQVAAPPSRDTASVHRTEGFVLPLFTSIEHAESFLKTIDCECDISQPLNFLSAWYFLTSPPGFGPTTQMELVIDMISPTERMLRIPRKPIVDELERIIEAAKLGTG